MEKHVLAFQWHLEYYPIHFVFVCCKNEDDWLCFAHFVEFFLELKSSQVTVCITAYIVTVPDY